MKVFKYKHIIIEEYHMLNGILYFTTTSFSFSAIIKMLRNSECRYLGDKKVEISFINHTNIPVKKFLKNRIDFILKNRENSITPIGGHDESIC